MKEKWTRFKTQQRIAMDGVSEFALARAALAMSTCNGIIYVAGNGGSASIANHLCCDVTKGAGKGIRTHSLVANTAMLTAMANDFSYEDSISNQLLDVLRSEDVVVLISSSGSSPNIVKAAKVARAKGNTLIGLTGFNGGDLAKEASIHLHVQSKDYGVVEDVHQSIMHCIAQYIKRS